MSKRNEELAMEILQFLQANNLWQDVTIYFNGKAFSTSDYKGNYRYDNGDGTPVEPFVVEPIDPRTYFEYVAKDHILSMSFEGPLYDIINYGGNNNLLKKFNAIFSKYDLYYELGNQWNLSCYS